MFSALSLSGSVTAPKTTAGIIFLAAHCDTRFDQMSLQMVPAVHRLGLPTSSSQCITGGIVGVGLMEGFQKGVNWRMFAKQFLSWVSTLFVVGLAVGAIFAQVRCTGTLVGSVLADCAVGFCIVECNMPAYAVAVGHTYGMRMLL